MNRRSMVKKAGAVMLTAALTATTVYVPTYQSYAVVKAESKKTVYKTWTFQNSAESWYYGTGWEYQYSGKDNSSVEYQDGRLKVNVDYSQDGSQNWSQMAACVWENSGMNLKGVNAASFDFFYDKTCYRKGSFKVKAFINDYLDTFSTIDFSLAEDVPGTTLVKIPVELNFDEITTDKTINDFALCLIGSNNNYKGSLYIDNISLYKDAGVMDAYVNSTVKPTGNVFQQSIKNGKLISYDAQGNEIENALAIKVPLVDRDATSETRQIYSYLKAIGESDSVIFGHQDDIFQKAGSKNLSCSDVYDVTNSYAGVFGIDTLAMTGNEYSASRYNNEIAAKTGAQRVPETAAGNVQAVAALTNQAVDNGAIVTLSSHMPNFSKVNQSGNYDGIHSYSKYDFKGYTVNDLSGDVMNQLLPGGKYNEVFTAYLDMIADYASKVDGAVLFRPFHENTGGWFWWGASCCDAETYKSVYRYTVNYLHNDKNVHNFIYEYGPSSDAQSISDYEMRYPGDAYVDLVGFDIYDRDPKANDTWINSVKTQLNLVQDFANAHNKLMAVTETGMAASTPDKGDNQTAVHHSGNLDKDWYNKVLDAVSDSDASYFLLWANFAESDGFYTPYVKKVNSDGTLYGHELLDNFIDYFNDPRSIFTENQKTALEELKNVTVTTDAVTDSASGYIVAPISGSRILEPVKIVANVSNTSADAEVSFVLEGANNVIKTIQAVSTDGETYTAQLTQSVLAELGAHVGTLTLTVDGKDIQTNQAIYNIKPPVEDPLVVDDFDDYYGVETVMAKAWATNQATANDVSLNLTDEEGTYYNGTHGLKFSYTETSDGWGGATILKSANWSSCNALQIWTVPDKNNQKTVLQITAKGTVYEVYLNEYSQYKNAEQPVLITIPFSEFCDRDTAGNPKGGLVNDASAISSFGLWVNAIDGSEAVVDGKVSGTIYYDAIKAVQSDKTEITFEEQDVVEPSESPSPSPSVEPSESPSPTPSVEPSESPSPTPSVEPSESPSPSPSVEPSESPSPTPSVEPSESPSPTPSVEPSESPSPTPSAEPSPSPSITPVTGAVPEVSVVSNISGSISQQYTIKQKNTGDVDLEKVKIRFNYTKNSMKEQIFWCDNAGLMLPTAPYYVNYTPNVKATFGNGYLEIAFTKSQLLNNGSLAIGTRFAQSDWSAYAGFKAGVIEVFYDGQLVQLITL